ncbi:MAG: sigma-54 dependent transcriptional regulator [Holophagales bacterium]|nr:sigma-54 dependent transcriptional regulator [Holophagales bacterium]
MSNLPRLHWSTLGEPTSGIEHRWSSQWEITLDRNAAPALPPTDTDLWAISVGTQEPPYALIRMSGEVAALPILLLRRPNAGPLAVDFHSAWSAIGSLRWGILSEDPPLPGLRPAAQGRPPLTASQALGLGMVGIGSAMQAVLAKARAAAATKATVMLTGESGTGKEVVAKAIHRMSADADGPFVPVHCGAIPENLVESELFGYTKGAFTDARKDTPGKFREAHEGTIFLDEVATMPVSAQVRLLRVLQEREVQPLGGGSPIKIDVRVVVATNQDLWKKVQDGSFREDLFYRLDVIPISLPPLRDRREEVPFLAQHFLNRKAREHGLYPKALHPSVDPLLMALPWQGNVRQLENAIERAIVLSATRAVLTRDDFNFLLDRVPEGEALVSSLPPAPLFGDTAPSSVSAAGIGAGSGLELKGAIYSSYGSLSDLPPDGLDLNQVVAEMEKKYLLQALSITRGNKKRAAELLNLKRTTLLEKLKRLDIQDEEAPEPE